jgi:hypothetical protein
MKSFNKIVGLGILVSTLFFSCGSPTPKEQENNNSPNKENCVYSYVNDSTGVFFTAYKFSNKLGVNGRFDVFTASETEKSLDPMAFLTNFSLKVDVSSVNTKDTSRDGKLYRFFFQQLVNTPMIEGKIISVDGNKGVMTFKMNDIEREVPFSLNITNETVELRTTIDVLDWNGQDAMDSIGEVCSELHVGADGVRKLWSEVAIYIKTTLKKECL